MARIRKKLQELTDADVHFISLVKRASTRIPIRVLKRDEENEMDLSKIFKNDKGENPKPEVTALVVFTQKDEKLAEAVRKAITDSGFKTDTVQKSDEETLVYSQVEKHEEGEQLVKISDQMLVVLKGAPLPTEGSFAQLAKTQGFYPGMSGAMDALYGKLIEAQKSDDLVSVSKQAVEEFSAYANALTAAVPLSCFKADAAVNETLQKAAEDAKKAEEEDAKKAEEEVKKADKMKAVMGMMKEGMPEKDMKAKMVGMGMSEEEITAMMGKAKESMEAEKGDPNGNGMKPNGTTVTVEKKKCHKCEKELTEGEEHTCEEPAKKEEKSELVQVLEALNGLKSTVESQGTQLQSIATKQDEIVKKQDEQQKVLDETVKKAETLDGKLQTTVLAPVTREDRPAGSKVTKQEDDDPRKGYFDTAFLPGRKRR